MLGIISSGKLSHNPHDDGKEEDEDYDDTENQDDDAEISP
jgi:hypothetical protein